MGALFTDFASRNPISTEVDLPTMIRHLPFVCILAVAPILAQAQQPQQQVTPPSAQSSQPPAAMVGNKPQPVQPIAPVAADAAVLTVHGVCAAGQKAPADKPDSCTLVLTRAQF